MRDYLKNLEQKKFVVHQNGKIRRQPDFEAALKQKFLEEQ
jgi:hypothetical protein